MSQEMVSSMVVHTTSLNNIFISTVDHLPCDVVRSLWLIQSCNTTLEKYKKELNEILLDIQNGILDKFSSEVVDRIINLKKNIFKYSGESAQEARALHNQLIAHKLTLSDELDQLQEMSSTISLEGQKDTDEGRLLRDQLKEYYKENPLKSQEEALQGHKMSKFIKSKQDKSSSGLKLFLKLKGKKRGRKPKAKTQSPTVKFKPASKLPLKTSSVIQPVSELEYDSNLYCFCKQPSFGDMIGCDNEESCPNGDWFHYKCVGLLNRVDALKYSTGKEKWFCSEYCRNIVAMKNKRRRKR